MEKPEPLPVTLPVKILNKKSNEYLHCLDKFQ
jgi:hypothetical protein